MHQENGFFSLINDVQAICNSIKSTAEPIFAEYVGQYKIEAIEFKNLSLGNLPPTVHGELDVRL